MKRSNSLILYFKGDLIMKKLVSTEEMLISENERELYREAMELHLKTDVSVGECAEIIQMFTK